MRSVVINAVCAAVDLLRWAEGWRGRAAAVRALIGYAASPSTRDPSAVPVALGPVRFHVRPGRAEIGAVREVWVDRVYDRLPEFTGGPGWTVVDAGAHIGTFTVRQAFRVRPGGRVVAVEPNPAAFAQLEAHIRLNRLDNVGAVCRALSDVEGAARFAVSPRGPMASKMLEEGEPVPADWELISVPSTTLDRLSREQGLDRIDLLKIDVEGAELRVLAGGGDTVDRTRRIIVESLGDAQADVRAFLLGRGFAFRLEVGTVQYYGRPE